MNELQLNSSEYIDCNTPKKKRDNIIEKYKKGEIPFLVNVRILVEGFDAPITKGVCFLHLPTNKTTLIQIIGRCLRLHQTKTIANIILPFSSKEDEKNICNFLKVMAKNDSRIRKSFESKTLGGYISIENLEENEDIKFKYNMIYDSMGILQNYEEIWMKRLEDVKLYIDTNNKRPSYGDKNYSIKKLGQWISNQQIRYYKKSGIMKDEKMYNTWTKFIEKYALYFQSYKEHWYYILNKIKIYMDQYNKKPFETDTDKNIRFLSRWLQTQLGYYKTKTGIMKNEEIYNKWTEFITNDKYKIYFISNKEEWIKKLYELKLYIDTNNKKPYLTDININIKTLCYWIDTQKKIYKKKEKIMKDKEIYNLWTEFINDDRYSKYFISYDDIWYQKFSEVKKYIDGNNKLPSNKNIDKNVKKLGIWLTHQKTHYKINTGVISDSDIYDKWTEFINDEKYKKYFLSNVDEWYQKFSEVKKYIDDNNKRPSKNDKDKNIKILGTWIQTQQESRRIKTSLMSNSIIYNKWTEFINDSKYKKYFLSNEEYWIDILNQVKLYIDINNKRPTITDKNNSIKVLGKWLSHQRENYKNKEHIMTNEEIYNLWTEFINNPKYKVYFESNEESWIKQLDEIKLYIDTNNKRPSQTDKQLYSWIYTQQNKYKKKIEIMKNEEIYNLWTEFINNPQYKKYF
jgi:hypothetical protein